MGESQRTEVRIDDPAAHEGVPAWSGLTGNEFFAVVDENAERARSYPRKKS